jgi:hypothetical protein
MTAIEAENVLLELGRQVGLDRDDLAGLMALIASRNVAERLCQGLLNGEVTATYTGPREPDGSIPQSALLDSRHFLFHPVDTWVGTQDREDA